MILKIGSLALPESTLSVSEITLRVSDKQVSASGDWIVREPVEKWKSTVDMGAMAMEREFQAAFYALCRQHVAQKATVTILSPYDGTEEVVQMICTAYPPPELIAQNSRIWRGVSAVWEEP